jgi:putative transposase
LILTQKIRIKPNKTTIKLLNQYFGYSRYIFNQGLDLWNKNYKENLKPNGRKIRDELKSLKKENDYEWEKALSPQILDTSVEDLEHSFKMFFKGINKYPKFKSKRKSKKSCRFYRKNDSTIRIKKDKLFLSKFPYGIKLTESIKIKGIIKTCTISTTAADKYFASFSIELNEEEENSLFKNEKDNFCGIDLGIKEFAVIGNENNEFTHVKSFYNELKPYYEKIKRYSRLMSKKQYNSNKYIALKTKIQNTYLRIKNKQNDFLNKLTTQIIKDYKTICIENLNTRFMIKNRKLSERASKSLFYNFRVKLEYKSKLYGNNLILADRFFPSTQKCSSCGNIKTKKDKLGLKDRVYICEECGCIVDRDENAAINLLDYGKDNIFKNSQIKKKELAISILS